MATLHSCTKFTSSSRITPLLRISVEFLAPLRLVLRGFGLTIGALSLVLCALVCNSAAMPSALSSAAARYETGYK